LIKRYNIEERRKRNLQEQLTDVFDFKNYGHYNTQQSFERLDITTRISTDFKEKISDVCKEKDIADLFSGDTLKDLIEWFDSLKLGRGNKKSSLRSILERTALHELLKNVSDQKIAKDAEGLEYASNNLYIDSLEQATRYIIRFFSSKIRYLGPLRADPKAVQGYSSSSELDDVGIRGENAAAVYDANQNALVTWYNPYNKEVTKGKLKDALNCWANYLGVANQIGTNSGISGVSWQVTHLEGQKALPLIGVGVGVSQILPILVMGLLSPPNSLLILEQPELHLHPSVQSKLGDFFVGLSKCGKQCIIETHSENLVNQIRYHIVEAEEDEKNNYLIYFASQNEEGATQFEKVQISSKGNILNWPEGFFDESMHQEDLITATSLRKRAKLVNALKDGKEANGHYPN
jgi:predicted ATPase